MSPSATRAVATHQVGDNAPTEVAIGGTGIYPIDTYNERVMDVEWDDTPAEVHPHFPYPSGIGTSDITPLPVDITMDGDENFRIATQGLWCINCDEQYDAEAANNTINDITSQYFCFSFWIRMPEGGISSGDTNHIFGKRSGTGMTQLGYWCVVAGLADAPHSNIQFFMMDYPNLDFFQLYGSSTVADGDRHHVAILIDRNNPDNDHCKIYFDGADAGNVQLTDVPATISNTGIFHLGSLDGELPLNGEIFDFKYRTGSLWSSSEVSYQAANRFDYSSSAGNITEYWKCNEGEGRVVNGSAGNDLTLISTDAWHQYIPSSVKKLVLHYDYALIDSKDGVERGTVLYRESYPVTTVEGYNDWTGL